MSHIGEEGSATNRIIIMIFIAEIKSTKQTKKILDNVYQLVLETNDPSILDLGKLPPDVTVKVSVESNG